MNDLEKEQLIRENWDEILQYLKKENAILEASFRTWIQILSIVSVKNDVLILEVGDELAEYTNFIIRKYGIPLEVSIEEITKLHLGIDVQTTSSVHMKKKPVTPVETNVRQNPLLDNLYTFDTFVVGNNNFVYQACLAVAEAPGKDMNPLFIYGGVGLGKTHLMKAIGNYILRNDPQMNVLYVTSETFTNDVIESIRDKNDVLSKQKLHQKYRNVDVLLIDDIQFIIGKESTQVEFFNTFNSLIEIHKQIVITSDKPPRDMKTLEERMRSRFQSGLIVDMQTPEYETRMAILKRKVEVENIQISEEALDYIATNITSNVRELEGALKSIMAVARFHDTTKGLDLELVKEELNKIIFPNSKRVITVEYIINIVSDHYNITTEDILSNKRSSNIAYPRQVCMYLCQKFVDATLQEIADKMGGKNHSTIIYGCKKIKEDLEKDAALKRTIDTLIKKINPS